MPDRPFQSCSVSVLCLLLLSLLLLPTTAWSLAFPTAEGFGADTVGGRGGLVHKVTSLADSGPGTLRACVEASGPRTCIFEIAGTIDLESDLLISNDFITIAGQTAPHQGVQVRNWRTIVQANQVIIRHMKFRPGVEWALAQGEFTDTRAFEIGEGSFGLVTNVILDHVEISWSGYQALNFFGPVQDITVQWTIMCCGAGTEDSTYPALAFNFAYGTIMTSYAVGGTPVGQTVSFHHNLLHDFKDRQPNFSGRIPEGAGGLFAAVDYRNNFVTDTWSCEMGAFGNFDKLIVNPNCEAEGNCLDGPFDIRVNVVGNVWEIPPAHIAADPGILGCKLQAIGGSGGPSDTRVYILDNESPFCPTAPDCPATDWGALGFTDFDPNLSDAQVEARFRVFSPFAYPAVTTHTAAELRSVLIDGTTGAIGVGPRRPVIDTWTQQILDELQNQTSTRGRNGTWPDLTSGGSGVPTDTDDDGLPDSWETNIGLNPLDEDDAAGLNGTTGYTFLEDYLNFLAGDAQITAGEPVAVEWLQHPTSDVVGVSLTPAPSVRIVDDQGGTVFTSNATVTVTIGNNPGGASLAGTVNVAAVNGVATFPNLSLNQPGVGYTLVASSSGLTNDTSFSFNIDLAPEPGEALRVNPINPRYFSDPNGNLVYLAGAYDWNFARPDITLQETTDYLNFWQNTNQNLIRGVNHDSAFDTPASNPPFNTAYFTHMSNQIQLAKDRGIYVLFAVLQHTLQAPFDNIAFCEQYARNVVDAIGQHENLLLEIGNELDSETLDAGVPASFAQTIADAIRSQQIANNMPLVPIGISEPGYQAAGWFTAMLNAPAPITFIVPGGNAVTTETLEIPPDQEGAKVILFDTDHVWPYHMDHVWVWRTFMTGHNPQVLDGNEFIPDHSEDDADQNSPLTFDARMRIGDTRLYAARINLEQAIPDSTVSTTGYALSNPGVHYLVYQADLGGAPFDVTLTDHRYKVEWFDPVAQTVTLGVAVRGPGARTFTPPFANDAVLLLEEEPEPQTPTNPIGCVRCSGFFIRR